MQIYSNLIIENKILQLSFSTAVQGNIKNNLS